LERGGFHAIKALLAEDAMLIGDGGGKVPSFAKPKEAGRRIAQLFDASSLCYGSELGVKLVLLNGQ
jgi:RNA polymerase sigma-70 factor (ECF subfamily)